MSIPATLAPPHPTRAPMAGLVPATTDSLSPFSAANMLLDHARALHATSYDKAAGKFHIAPPEAFAIAATMFQFAFNADRIAAVMARAAIDLGVPDGYAELVRDYVAPDSIYGGGVGRPPVPPTRAPATSRP